MQFISAEIGEKMRLLWWDDGFQECLKCTVEYQLSDSAPCHFQRMDKILDHSYTPNEQDVLHSHIQTTEIVETTFTSGNITYQLFDVGGQQSERRKWLHCFDDVKAVLFVAALSGYDMTLTENGTTNRIEESLNLFQANNTNHHLRQFFPQYAGPDHDVPAAKEFINDQFLARNTKERIIYPHFTTATDTINVKVVFKVVLNTFI